METLKHGDLVWATTAYRNGEYDPPIAGYVSDVYYSETSKRVLFTIQGLDSICEFNTAVPFTGTLPEGKEWQTKWEPWE